jgi:hypothetical protein
MFKVPKVQTQIWTDKDQRSDTLYVLMYYFFKCNIFTEKPTSGPYHGYMSTESSVYLRNVKKKPILHGSFCTDDIVVTIVNRNISITQYFTSFCEKISIAIQNKDYLHV